MGYLVALDDSLLLTAEYEKADPAEARRSQGLMLRTLVLGSCVRSRAIQPHVDSPVGGSGLARHR